MVSALPFDDFRSLLGNLPDGDDEAERRAREGLRSSAGAENFAGLLDLAAWLARWTGRMRRIQRPLVAVFAGAHGLACGLNLEAGMKATHRLVERLGTGAEPVNGICAASELGLKVFELALDVPTGDISQEAALSERDCAATMAFGMEAIAGGMDLLCLVGAGDGGSVAAAAVLAALHDGFRTDWSADGDGAIGRECEFIRASLSLHRAHLADPLEVLRRLGGREIAAIVGAIIAARIEKVPVILEGSAALAAAAVLHKANPQAVVHCRLAGLPPEPALSKAAARIGLQTLLHVPFGCTAGAGAALAAGMAKSVTAMFTELPPR